MEWWGIVRSWATRETWMIEAQHTVATLNRYSCQHQRWRSSLAQTVNDSYLSYKHTQYKTAWSVKLWPYGSTRIYYEIRRLKCNSFPLTIDNDALMCMYTTWYINAAFLPSVFIVRGIIPIQHHASETHGQNTFTIGGTCSITCNAWLKWLRFISSENNLPTTCTM